MTRSTAIPNDIGPQRINDRRGWLVFDGLPDYLQHKEDATLHNDHQRVADDEYSYSTSFTRGATPTERLLLLHLGYQLPDTLDTFVEWLSNGVRRRSWPALETEGAQT